MTQLSDPFEATLDLIRAVDPVSGLEADAPDTETALRVLLANVPAATPSRPRRSRRFAGLGAVALGTVAATLVVINVESGGTGEISRTLGGSGVLVSQARAAEIIAKVSRALTRYGPDQIVVTKQLQRTTVGNRTILLANTNDWQSSSAPYRERFAESTTPGTSYDQSTTANGIPQVYDPANNTIYQRTAEPLYKLSRGSSTGTWRVTVPRANVYGIDTPVPAADRGTEQITVSDAVASALRSGVDGVIYGRVIGRLKARTIGIAPHIGAANDSTSGDGAPVVVADWVSGLKTRGTRVRLDGKSAIEIYSPSESATFWFSAGTLHPLKMVSRGRYDTSSGKPTSKHEVTTIRFTDYQVLRSTTATERLLLLQDAYPKAKLVVGHRQYVLAGRRLRSQ
jgi:hypothetical protein